MYGRAGASEWAVILCSIIAGLGARRCIAGGRSRALFVLSALVILGATGRFLSALGVGDRDHPPGYLPHAVGWVVFQAAPFLLVLALAASKRRRPQFALGAVGACAVFWWDMPLMLLVPLFAFVVARDLGANKACTPTRQRFAQYGVGALAITFALALGFDLAATLTYDTGPYLPWGPDGPQSGFRGDAPLPRWLRMFTEAAVIASCFAHSRGRTWGVLALLVLLPAVGLQILTSGFHLPYWSSGCIETSHILRLNPYLVPFALMALLPWLVPLVRGLFPQSSTSSTWLGQRFGNRASRTATKSPKR